MWVITFPSVTHALRAEKLLKEKGIQVKLIPIPKELSGACQGLAAKLPGEDVEESIALLDNHGIDIIRRGIQIKM
ncbi:MAG: DUF3343 domain-containing protein [Pelosinus sp.]|nr:DUF3343 domain-containing protein [Pelosinus sp.]